jgi:hypothetical protein
METLIHTSKKAGLQVNAEKTKYMFMSHHQTAGQNRNMKTANRSFENVVQFKYLGMKVTNQNLIEEEIKEKLDLGNACYHSVRNLLSSPLSKNVRINYAKLYFACGFILV